MLIEFLISWRPSFPDPNKHIFQNALNLTNRKTYSNPVSQFLGSRYIPWQVITSRNQHMCKWRHLISP
jgi:hypothetical protein